MSNSIELTDVATGRSVSIPQGDYRLFQEGKCSFDDLWYIYVEYDADAETLEMSKSEILYVYNSYLDEMTEVNPKYTPFKRGILHGLGIVLGYDYEDVESDIRQVRQTETLPGQISLAI